MGGLPTTILGRTGLKVTRLGIGGAYCPTPEGYIRALDCGATYVDTAPAYRDGDDERVVGLAIAGRRQDLVLATKTGKRDAAGARAQLEHSLRLLGTDYVDVWQMHYVNNDEELQMILGPSGAMEAAVKAQAEGLVRHIGITGHNWSAVGRAVATGLFDTVLCWYNCAMPEPETLVFPEADAHGTGVVIMNATRTDKLLAPDDAPPIAGFYRYVLSHPSVDVVLRGLREPIARFCEVAQSLAERATLDAEARQVYTAYGARLRREGKLDYEEG
ncbi:MAG: aldo/keto reductase [Anaerolineae bacterium]|nr:aldo/keto reductase [Anaerolineae bacterium]